MSKKYNLRVNEKLTKIFEVYIKLDPLKKHATISQYLTKLIEDDAERILDMFRSRLETDKELQALLKKQEYEEVLKAINFNSD